MCPVQLSQRVFDEWGGIRCGGLNRELSEMSGHADICISFSYLKNRKIWVVNVLDIWVYDLSGIRYVAIECNIMFYMLHFYKFSD